MIPEPYDIQRDDRASKYPYRECHYYRAPRLGVKWADIGTCTFEGMLCQGELQGSCGLLDWELEQEEEE